MLTQTKILANDNELSLFGRKADNLFDENLLIDEEKKKVEEKNEVTEKNISNNDIYFYISVIVGNQNYESLSKYYSQDIDGKNNKNS